MRESPDMKKSFVVAALCLCSGQALAERVETRQVQDADHGADQIAQWAIESCDQELTREAQHCPNGIKSEDSSCTIESCYESGSNQIECDAEGYFFCN